MVEKMGKILLIVAFFFTLFTIFWVSINNYWIQRDLGGLLYRAMVAAHHEEMVEYMRMLKKNMEEREMTQGYRAVLSRDPRYNLKLDYGKVEKIIARLEGLNEIGMNTRDYKENLVDIRTSISRFDITRNMLWIRTWWTLPIIFILWIAGFIAIGNKE